MKILYPIPSELIDDGVRSIMTYIHKINRFYKEEFTDLYKAAKQENKSPASVAGGTH